MCVYVYPSVCVRVCGVCMRSCFACVRACACGYVCVRAAALGLQCRKLTAPPSCPAVARCPCCTHSVIRVSMITVQGTPPHGRPPYQLCGRTCQSVCMRAALVEAIKSP